MVVSKGEDNSLTGWLIHFRVAVQSCECRGAFFRKLETVATSQSDNTSPAAHNTAIHRWSDQKFRFKYDANEQELQLGWKGNYVDIWLAISALRDFLFQIQTSWIKT